MTDYLFTPFETPSIAIIGEDKVFPINRIFCVGRNYAAHAAEMGASVDREAPFYFLKSAQSYCPSSATIPYPPGTNDFHHEMELFIAIGAKAFEVRPDQAIEAVYGYGCGLDVTRRDLQAVAKSKQRPWDLGKNFENGAILAPITKADDWGAPTSKRIQLSVNGETKQDADLGDMIWSIEEIISDLSHYYHLEPGDIIMTGTPAGVGHVQPGDHLIGRIDGLTEVNLTIAGSV